MSKPKVCLMTKASPFLARTQILTSNATLYIEGVLEHFNSLLRAITTSNERLQFEYISRMLDTELASLERFFFYQFCLSCFYVSACFETVGVILDADDCFWRVEKCSLVV